jgi:hypothetical protein
MRTEQFGPVRLIRWSWEVERRLRAEAREHLLKKFQVGTYDDPVLANAILQHQFEFYAGRLEQAVDLIANRDALEFVLTQYEMAASITHGLGIQDASQREQWLRLEGMFRRAMKYLAELIALRDPMRSREVSRAESMRAMDQALLAVEMVVDLGEGSNRVHGVFPEGVAVRIYPPGFPIDWKVTIEGRFEGYDEKLVARVTRDRQHRGDFIQGHQFDLHTARHQEFLDPVFTAHFGWSYGHFLSGVRNLIEGSQPVPNSFPTLFVLRHKVVEQFLAQGAPPAAVEAMLNGFSVSAARMIEERRVVWNPKQEYRMYRRGFLEYPHELGLHLTFSKSMAEEAMIHLVHGVCYKRLPVEWKCPGLETAMERVSRQASRWFEDVVNDNLRKLGFVGARAKDRIGPPGHEVEIPADVGEIDFLGFDPKEKLLVVAEAKMVNSGLEAKYWRDDVSTFATDRGSYASKFQRKIAWVNEHSEALTRAIGVGRPERVVPVMVTLYPCIAQMFIDDFPCVSLAELMLDYREKNSWPYPA